MSARRLPLVRRTPHAASVGAFLCSALSLSVADADAEPAPLRFFPPAAFDGEGDMIVSGVRVSRGPSGEVKVAQERFEAGGAPRGMAVPDALGGGYLFYQPLGSSSGAGTALFRAKTWTGPLTPLGTAPFVVGEVESGFDRFYLLGSGRAIALDPEKGTYLPLDPLPPVASILDLDFEGGSASLRAPLVGRLSSDNSGLDWRAVGGESAPERAESGDWSSAALPRQGRWLESVVLRGGTLADGHVLALIEGQRMQLEPERGRLLQQTESGLDARARCQALPPGELRNTSDLLWFACTSGLGLELRAYGEGTRPQGAESSPQLVRRERFPHDARILAAGRLGVLLDLPCTPDAARSATSASRELCLVGRTGKQSLRAPARTNRNSPETFAVGGASVHRVFLLGDGTIASERLDAPARRTAHRVHREAELESLLLEGTWLPGATVFEEGISFWAVRGESYVGVRLERDGSLARVGAIERPLRRAFLSGSRVLSWGASGFARISVDSGMTFSEIDYPFVSGDPDPSGLASAEQALELGCGPAGCSLGTWVSVGWKAKRQRTAELVPPRITVPPLGGGRFRFLCTPTGEASPPALPAQQEALVGPFGSRPAPKPGLAQVVHSVGDQHGLARVYALGPEADSWGGRGQVAILFRSPFEARDQFESLPTADLFANSAEVQARLGTLDRMTQTVQTELDPGGRAGIMLIRTRQQTTLLAFSHQGSVQRFDVPEELGLISLSGVVYVRGRFLVGHVRGGEFRVIELSSGGLDVLGAFPLGETGPRGVTLTRTSAGDLGVAIDGDLGLLVYPLSRQGELGAALLQPFRGSRPPECPAAAEGYLVVQELGISPYVELLGSELEVGRVTVRRVVGFGPECIDGMAADLREGISPSLLRRGAVEPGGTSLVVTDRGETGRHARLSCH